MKKIKVYKGTGRSKKYHSANLEYNSLSICMWGIDRKNEKNIIDVKRDQLCKVCFCKYLKNTKVKKRTEIEIEETGRVKSRFELMDLE